MYRTLAHVILIVSIIKLPLFVVCVACVSFCVFFQKPFEVLVYGFLLDSIFYSANGAFTAIPLYTAYALLVYILVERIKPYLRYSYIS
ncbi:MAG: hypothetical protein RI996_472 [Candidatus Parcubacteria bacterium]|jgi:hypothetical protein